MQSTNITLRFCRKITPYYLARLVFKNQDFFSIWSWLDGVPQKEVIEEGPFDIYTFSYLSLRGGHAVLLGLASEPIFWELFSFWLILPPTRF